eukprot:825464-Rhodomonas_salina.1
MAPALRCSQAAPLVRGHPAAGQTPPAASAARARPCLTEREERAGGGGADREQGGGRGAEGVRGRGGGGAAGERAQRVCRVHLQGEGDARLVHARRLVPDRRHCHLRPGGRRHHPGRTALWSQKQKH